MLDAAILGNAIDILALDELHPLLYERTSTFQL
jgi:hypothetical protein